MSARIIEVIEVKTSRGNGKTTPIREVTTFYNRDGLVLAEHDPCMHITLMRAFERDTADVADLESIRGMIAEIAQ